MKPTRARNDDDDDHHYSSSQPLMRDVRTQLYIKIAELLVQAKATTCLAVQTLIEIRWRGIVAGRPESVLFAVRSSHIIDTCGSVQSNKNCM